MVFSSLHCKDQSLIAHLIKRQNYTVNQYLQQGQGIGLGIHMNQGSHSKLAQASCVTLKKLFSILGASVQY